MKVKITVTNEDCEVLDSVELETAKNTWGLGILELRKQDLDHPQTSVELILGDGR